MTTTSNTKTTVFSVKTIAKVAILAAIAEILMLIEFPLPIAPSFYKMDFSEVAVLIAGFALGPVEAVMVEGVKILLNFLFTGSSTMGVGELANFIIGCAFAVPASIIYRKNKSKKNAIIGMFVGTLCMTVAGVLLNWLVLIPAYVALAGFPMEAILGMGQAIHSSINSVLSLVLLCVTPFNLIKGGLVSLITMLLYKHISPLLHR